MRRSTGPGHRRRWSEPLTHPGREQDMSGLKAFIEGMPKCELHVHIEGTLEPEMKFELAQRNKIALPYRSEKALKAAYDFNDLSSFLVVYYEGMGVLLTEQDFYDLTYAY